MPNSSAFFHRFCIKHVMLAITVSTVLRDVVTDALLHVIESVEFVSNTARMDGLETGVIRLSVRLG